MLDDLDEALRELLIRDMPIVNNEVDISFDQPKREWSARLSRPTINLFLHDVRENNKMRTQQPYLNATPNGLSAAVGPNPIRLEVHYMITTWANDPGDEHRLMGRLLMVFFRYKALPEELYFGQLAGQDFDIWLKVAQYDQRDTRREIWNMLDNEMKPIIDLTATLAIEPYADWTVPLVRQTEIGFGQMGASDTGGLLGADRFYAVMGTVHGVEGLAHLSIQLLELAVPVTVAPNGRYTIQNLREGQYTVEVWTGVGEPTRHTIVVPSPPEAYDIYLS
ncbi:MAG TPA: DUF4255 domain-containing protein [Caldilineaceae bacterium]|nr:DUF4255 domain-containing protein [Caldilineaceae bacterium]